MQQLIQMKTETTETMAVAMNESLPHAFGLAVVTRATAVNHEEIRAIAVNPHPLIQHHEHDSDDTSIHWRAYTFYYSLKCDKNNRLALNLHSY